MSKYCIDKNMTYVLLILITVFFLCYGKMFKRKKKFNINNKILNKINFLENKYRQLVNKKSTNAQTSQPTLNTTYVQHQLPIQVANPIQAGLPNYIYNDPVDARDRQVVNDELYPPINRTERPVFDGLLNLYRSGSVGMATRGYPDTYRTIAIGKGDQSGNMFYLMGRQKYPGSSIGEFYLMSTDKSNQYKIQIDRNTIKDFYNIPDKIEFSDNDKKVFGDRVIHLKEYNKADLDSGYL